MNTLIKNMQLVSIRNNLLNVELQDIMIADGKIVSNQNFLPDRIIDADFSMAFPGLTNFHHHIYSFLAKGISVKNPIYDFKSTLENLWWQLDKNLDEDAVLFSTCETVKESINNGVTNVFDHHISSFGIENILGKMGETFKDVGFGGGICFEITDRYGNDFFEYSLEQNKNQLDYFPNHLVGLHASFTLSDKSLKRIALTFPNNPIHIHVGEDEYDKNFTKEKYGVNLIERFETFGLLRKNSLFVHGNVLDEKDFLKIQDNEAFIVRCPDSTANNALTHCDPTILDNLKNILPGTDGMNSSPLRSIKNQFLFQRLLSHNTNAGYKLAKTLFYNMFSKKQNFGIDLGINIGDNADLVISEYKPLSPISNDNLINHLIFGVCESRIKTVLKNKHILMENFINKVKSPFSQLDAEKISRKVSNRFNKE